MRRLWNLLAIGTIAATLCSADVYEIKQVLEAVLAPGGTVPDENTFLATINDDTVVRLSAQEVIEVSNLAKRALHSQIPDARRYGLLFFVAAGLRPDSSAVLDAFIDDIGAMANGPKDAVPPRLGALFVLGILRPSIAPKAVPYLLAILGDASSSSQELLTSAASLLRAFPKDQAILEKVVKLASARGDGELAIGVLQQLGLLRTREPQALRFFSSSLESYDAGIRWAAVEAVARLDREVKNQFAAQLGRIAEDNREAAELRRMANAAIEH